MMATVFAIFAIVTGMASLLGFLYVFFGAVTSGYKRLCAIGFSFAAVWSGYVLFIPGTSIEQNVAGKIAYYQGGAAERQSDTLMIQRGEVLFSGFGPRAIEFPVPFRNIPDVEVINIEGYPSQFLPSVEKATAHQVIFRRSTTSGANIESLHNYRWVARGIPLDEIAPKK